MNIERFRHLLEAYGSQEQNWPSAERHSAQQFVQDNTEGKKLLLEHRLLDIQLDEYLPRSSPRIRDNILENLPKSPVDMFLNWLIPEMQAGFWRPIAVGALPLVIGIAIGINTSASDPDLFSTYSADLWETEEVYFLALDDSQISMESIDE